MSINDVVGLAHLIAGPGGGILVAAAIIIWANWRGIWVWSREVQNQVAWRDIKIHELEIRNQFLEEEKRDFRAAGISSNQAAEQLLAAIRKAEIGKR